LRAFQDRDDLKAQIYGYQLYQRRDSRNGPPNPHQNGVTTANKPMDSRSISKSSVRTKGIEIARGGHQNLPSRVESYSQSRSRIRQSDATVDPTGTLTGLAKESADPAMEAMGSS
jgi:hypothetical protein